MSHNPVIERLLVLIEPVCKDAGCEVVDLRLVMEQGGWVLRVCIDHPIPDDADLSKVLEGRVDLSVCEQVSRMLSATLDVEDPIPQAYSLEVSSPGIDRPLRTVAHFRRFEGAEAKVQLAVPLVIAGAERRNFRGVLRGVGGDPGKELVQIDVDGKRFELPLADVDSARLVPDWDDVMRGGSGVSRPASSADKGASKSKTKSKTKKGQASGSSPSTSSSPNPSSAVQPQDDAATASSTSPEDTRAPGGR